MNQRMRHVIAFILVAAAATGCPPAGPGAITPTGTPVTAATPLHAGDHVEVEWNGQWWNGQVLSLQSDGARVHYTGWDSSWDEWVPRERLRVPDASGAETASSTSPPPPTPVACDTPDQDPAYFVKCIFRMILSQQNGAATSLCEDALFKDPTHTKIGKLDACTAILGGSLLVANRADLARDVMPKLCDFPVFGTPQPSPARRLDRAAFNACVPVFAHSDDANVTEKEQTDRLATAVTIVAAACKLDPADVTRRSRAICGSSMTKSR